jgi:hypothetical protein
MPRLVLLALPVLLAVLFLALFSLVLFLLLHFYVCVVVVIFILIDVVIVGGCESLGLRLRLASSYIASEAQHALDGQVRQVVDAVVAGVVVDLEFESFGIGFVVFVVLLALVLAFVPLFAFELVSVFCCGDVGVGKVVVDVG